MAKAGTPYHAARRLTRVIRLLQAEADSIGPSATFLEVLAASTGKDTRNPALLGELRTLFELPRQVLRDLDRLDGEQIEFALTAINTVSRTFVMANVSRSWVELYAEFGEVGMAGLGAASALLDADSTERALDEEELQRIAEEVRQILEDLRLTPSAPSNLTDFIEESLVAILRAVDDYWINGAESLEGAVDLTLGRAVREQQFTTKKMESHPLLKRVGKILASSALVLAMANDATSFVNAVDGVVHDVVSITAGPDQSTSTPSLEPPFGTGC